MKDEKTLGSERMATRGRRHMTDCAPQIQEGCNAQDECPADEFLKTGQVSLCEGRNLINVGFFRESYYSKK